MSSVQLQRELITDHLTPAEETFTEFKEIKSEEEMDDQGRLLGFTRTPQLLLHRIDNLLDCVWKKEVFCDPQLCKQESDSSLDQKEPEPLQIKEEQQEPEHPCIKEETLELCISEQEEKLVLKQETQDTFMVTPTLVENCYIKPEPIRNQIISQDSNETENQDQEGKHYEDSGSKRDKGLKTQTENFLYSCKICGVFFTENSDLILHLKSHTDENPFKCLSCGKSFPTKSTLDRHVRIHTGEKPFLCRTCGKGFFKQRDLTVHMRTHTGEKPFSCTICGKCFTQKGQLIYHMRVHTDERPFPCNTCEKSYKSKQSLNQHMRTHINERSFSCMICGESFICILLLSSHMKTHK